MVKHSRVLQGKLFIRAARSVIAFLLTFSLARSPSYQAGRPGVTIVTSAREQSSSMHATNGSKSQALASPSSLFTITCSVSAKQTRITVSQVCSLIAHDPLNLLSEVRRAWTTRAFLQGPLERCGSTHHVLNVPCRVRVVSCVL
ncbi:hypothetical protein RRG08_022292 [Elysia crispata]|uniref:Uncharacterized protein n=1 Tax=Elysia crispata TaxID=231223 RepID=A0AAE0ZQS0_9GAST|nr:hypothetical protein RRG08_022292 [Elysia crispata]